MFLHKLLQDKRGEIATTLTVIGVAVMAVGALIGTRLSQQSQDTRSFASSNCPYTFSTPSGEGTGRTITCRVPTSQANIPTLGCGLAQGDTWVSTSTHIGWDGTTALFSVTLNEGYGDGTYSLIAYKFNSATDTCTHADQVMSFTVGGTGQNTVQPTTPVDLPTTAPAASICSNDFTNGRCMSETQCIGTLGTVGYEVKSGTYDCKANAQVCCAPKTTTAPTPTPSKCTYSGLIECKGLCGASCVLSNGCYRCPADPTPTTKPTCTTGITDPGIASNACSGKFESVSNIPNCYRCITTQNATPTPTLKSVYLQPLSVQSQVRPGCSLEKTVNGYSVFNCEGNFYTIEYNPPVNKNLIFQVEGTL